VKALQEKIAALERENATLRSDLKMKEIQIQDLSTQIEVCFLFDLFSICFLFLFCPDSLLFGSC
jgi:cell division protein FtsB